MNVNKILFLDFDGVITTPKSGWNVDPEKCALLQKVIDATDCAIVLSTSWRANTLEQTKEALPLVPFIDRVIGITPRLPYQDSQRGKEIRKYLHELGRFPESFVILDDCDDLLPYQYDHLVLTDTYSGLTEKEVELAIRMLNGETS